MSSNQLPSRESYVPQFERFDCTAFVSEEVRAMSATIQRFNNSELVTNWSPSVRQLFEKLDRFEFTAPVFYETETRNEKVSQGGMYQSGWSVYGLAPLLLPELIIALTEGGLVARQDRYAKDTHPKFYELTPELLAEKFPSFDVNALAPLKRNLEKRFIRLWFDKDDYTTRQGFNRNTFGRAFTDLIFSVGGLVRSGLGNFNNLMTGERLTAHYEYGCGDKKELWRYFINGFRLVPHLRLTVI